MNYTIIKNEYTISADKSKIDIDYVHGFLTQSYWSPDIPIEIVMRAVEGSLCFGVYHNKAQIGFARMITDISTFAYMAMFLLMKIIVARVWANG